MRASTLLRAKPASCLLALALNLLTVRADDGPASIAAHALKLPTSLKRSPAGTQELAVAFSKPVPTSMADLRSIEDRVKALVGQLSPAVVAVEVGYASGSGVVISADGIVLTAGHVVGRPNREVRFTFPDGKIVRGKTLGNTSEPDAGLMKITDPGSWPYVAMGDLKRARMGDWVLALGHPGGFDLKRSLVVRLGRIIELDSDMLQTDCTISPGDSGGPLFNMQGEVIGIHSLISNSTADNFHVPTTKFSEVWDRLVRGGSIGDEVPPRAYAGATGADDSAGCRISKVDKNGPAFKAGLKVGDVVLKIAGRDIKASASFRRWIAESEPGETLKVDIKRGGQLLSLNVKLDARPRHD